MERQSYAMLFLIIFVISAAYSVFRGLGFIGSIEAGAVIALVAMLLLYYGIKKVRPD